MIHEGSVSTQKNIKILKISFTNKTQGKEEEFEYVRFLVTVYLVNLYLLYFPIIPLQLLHDLVYLFS
jgi:hypothetical protein